MGGTVFSSADVDEVEAWKANVEAEGLEPSLVRIQIVSDPEDARNYLRAIRRKD